MTQDDIVDLLSAVKLLWPHSDVTAGRPEAAVRLWGALLVDVTAEEALAAVRELATVRDHAPGPGVVAAKVAERRGGAPPWDEVWPEVRQLARECVTPRGYRIPKPEEFSHPLLAEWAVAHWRELCPGPLDPRAQTTHHAQQRDSYQAFTGRAARDQRLAIVGAERPRRIGEPRRINLELEAGSGD